MKMARCLSDLAFKRRAVRHLLLLRDLYVKNTELQLESEKEVLADIISLEED